MTGIKLLLMTCRRDSEIVIVIIGSVYQFSISDIDNAKKKIFFETFILALCNRLEDRAIH